MRVRALDSAGDWTFGAGANNYKQKKDAVAQNIQTRLNSFLGNCFFDLGAGLDWFFFLGGSKDQLALNLAISSVILNTENVTALTQVSINLNTRTRHIAITYRAVTSFGAITEAVVPFTKYLTTEDGDPLITESGENIIV